MSGGPRRFVVLGDPVEHSLSPVMHSAAFHALGLDAEYVRLQVDAEGMISAAAAVRAGEFDGANITMPHKRLAAELADRLADGARRAQSVNTWVRSGASIEGHSTDIVGVRRVVQELGMPEGPFVVLGTGGAAAASLIALEGHEITVMARRPDAGRAMAARCGVTAEVRPWDDRAPSGVVINCTPIGMSGEVMPDRFLDAATGYLEMVYARGETAAERTLVRRQVPVAGGISLLAAQAEASFELWFGVTPPPGIMYGSVDKCLKEDAGEVES